MSVFFNGLKIYRRISRFTFVKQLLLVAVFMPFVLMGQGLADIRLLKDSPLPEKILNGRTFVLVSPELTEKEIRDIHSSFIKTGIDAIGYCEADKVFAGADVTQAFVKYFQNREIVNLIFILKTSTAFELYVCAFDGSDNSNLFGEGRSGWKAQNKVLADVLMTLYRTALNAQKRQNLLINEVPETDLALQVITGTRKELFAYDLKVDGLAVQKFGDEKMDLELEEIMKSYPFKYQLVDPKISEPDLRKQGFLYLLRYIHTRGPAAKQLLGYDMSKGESALVSVTYPNGQEQIKTIPADVAVYKFYVRQIEFSHVFLGPKWDADTAWQQALKNFIKGLRNEMKVN